MKIRFLIIGLVFASGVAYAQTEPELIIPTEVSIPIGYKSGDADVLTLEPGQEIPQDSIEAQKLKEESLSYSDVPSQTKKGFARFIESIKILLAKIRDRLMKPQK